MQQEQQAYHDAKGSLTRRAYFSESAERRSELLRTSADRLSCRLKRALRVVASASAVSISALRRATIAGGVLTGTKAPYHDSIARPLKPASCKVGTLGKLGERVTPIILRSVVTRSASKCENSPSARHYDQIRLSFRTAKTQTGHRCIAAS